MKKATVLSILCVVLLLVVAIIAEAQQPKGYRVGVITAGGAWYETIDGLRIGLRELGLEEEKQFVLAIRDTKMGEGVKSFVDSSWDYCASTPSRLLS